jgi:hypothetical protein
LKKINISLSHTNLVSSSISLSSFDDVYSTPSRFKLGVVYQRHHPLPLPSFEPPPDLVLHDPRRSTRFPGPQIGMVFLLLLLSLFLRLLLKSVSAKLCRMNFMLFKTITRRTSSLVLLEVSLLGANGSTPSSYVPMALSKDIKLVWWHSGINRSMGLITRKHLFPWPK